MSEHDTDTRPHGGGPKVSLVSPSYAPDLERCELLVESVRRHVRGLHAHYLLIDRKDRTLFTRLEGGKVKVVVTEELLPFRTLPVNLARRLWLTAFSAPLRGWIVQQFAKIAFAAAADDDVLAFVDSDCFFRSDFDAAERAHVNGAVRLFRGNDTGLENQRTWNAIAYEKLGIRGEPGTPGYIGNFVTWRPENVRRMCQHLQQSNQGRPWYVTLSRQMRWSEYILYGNFCERVIGTKDAGHCADDSPICLEHWDEKPMSRDEVKDWLDQDLARMPLAMISAKSCTGVSVYRDLVLG